MEKDNWRLLIEGGLLSLNIDGDNLLQESGDALLLQVTETYQLEKRFSKDGKHSPALKKVREWHERR